MKRSFLSYYLILLCVFFGFVSAAQTNNYSMAYNVKDYGATAVIPAGNYLCGSIRLASNINLFISAGAKIIGAPAEMRAYDTAEIFPGTQYQDGDHTYFHNSLIWRENLHNVSITGRAMKRDEV